MYKNNNNNNNKFKKSCRVQCCLKDSWQLLVKASKRFSSLPGRVETTSLALSSLDETCLCQFTAFRRRTND